MLVLIPLAGPATAQTSYSPDVTVSLSGTVVSDEDVAEDDFAGSVGLADLGNLPEAAEVDAFTLDGADRLFSLDITSQLPGGPVARPADVIRYDGSTYTLAFDAAAAGVPEGANVDAVSVGGSGLHLSFDTTVDLGGGVTAADEDLVLHIGGGFVISFDGSAAGLDEALDLDAANVQPDGSFVLSLDQSGTIGGIVFDDDTVLIHDGAIWAVAVDASDEDPSFAAADLVAVPEPGLSIALACGLAAMLARSGTRRRSKYGIACGLFAIFGGFLGAPSAWASDGVAEINQTCAVQTGCFAGDAAGFPVTIVSGGSYRLTSNLDLSAEDPSLSAIFGTAPGIRLDLGGFEVKGPTTCTGSGPTIVCSPGPLGTGGISFTIDAVGPTVSNGTVRGFARAGVVSEAVGLRVEGLTVVGNFDDGVAAVPGAIVRDSTFIENGRDGVEVDGGRIENVVAIGNGIFGIEIDGPGGVVRDSTAMANGSSGFDLVSLSKYGKDNTSQGNGAEDSCGGRFCSENKRFYLDGAFAGGTSPPGDFCDAGFRLIRSVELAAGHLARYEGQLSTSSINVEGAIFRVSLGGGSKNTNATPTAGEFDCVDTDLSFGGSSGFLGIRCSHDEVVGLTSGWHEAVSLSFTGPTLCVEE